MDTVQPKFRRELRVVVENKRNARRRAEVLQLRGKPGHFIKRTAFGPKLDEIDASGKHLLQDAQSIGSGDVAEIENAVEAAGREIHGWPALRLRPLF